MAEPRYRPSPLPPAIPAAPGSAAAPGPRPSRLPRAIPTTDPFAVPAAARPSPAPTYSFETDPNLQPGAGLRPIIEPTPRPTPTPTRAAPRQASEWSAEVPDIGTRSVLPPVAVPTPRAPKPDNRPSQTITKGMSLGALSLRSQLTNILKDYTPDEAKIIQAEWDRSFQGVDDDTKIAKGARDFASYLNQMTGTMRKAGAPPDEIRRRLDPLRLLTKSAFARTTSGARLDRPTENLVAFQQGLRQAPVIGFLSEKMAKAGMWGDDGTPEVLAPNFNPNEWLQVVGATTGQAAEMLSAATPLGAASRVGAILGLRGLGLLTPEAAAILKGAGAAADNVLLRMVKAATQPNAVSAIRSILKSSPNLSTRIKAASAAAGGAGAAQGLVATAARNLPANRPSAIIERPQTLEVETPEGPGALSLRDVAAHRRDKEDFISSAAAKDPNTGEITPEARARAEGLYFSIYPERKGFDETTRDMVSAAPPAMQQTPAPAWYEYITEPLISAVSAGAAGPLYGLVGRAGSRLGALGLETAGETLSGAVQQGIEVARGGQFSLPQMLAGPLAAGTVAGAMPVHGATAPGGRLPEPYRPPVAPPRQLPASFTLTVDSPEVSEVVDRLVSAKTDAEREIAIRLAQDRQIGQDLLEQNYTKRYESQRVQPDVDTPEARAQVRATTVEKAVDQIQKGISERQNKLSDIQAEMAGQITPERRAELEAQAQRLSQEIQARQARIDRITAPAEQPTAPVNPMSDEVSSVVDQILRARTSEDIQAASEQAIKLGLSSDVVNENLKQRYPDLVQAREEYERLRGMLDYAQQAAERRPNSEYFQGMLKSLTEDELPRAKATLDQLTQQAISGAPVPEQAATPEQAPVTEQAAPAPEEAPAPAEPKPTADLTPKQLGQRKGFVTGQRSAVKNGKISQADSDAKIIERVNKDGLRGADPAELTRVYGLTNQEIARLGLESRPSEAPAQEVTGAAPKAEEAPAAGEETVTPAEAAESADAMHEAVAQSGEAQDIPATAEPTAEEMAAGTPETPLQKAVKGILSQRGNPDAMRKALNDAVFAHDPLDLLAEMESATQAPDDKAPPDFSLSDEGKQAAAELLEDMKTILPALALGGALAYAAATGAPGADAPMMALGAIASKNFTEGWSTARGRREFAKAHPRIWKNVVTLGGDVARVLSERGRYTFNQWLDGFAQATDGRFGRANRRHLRGVLNAAVKTLGIDRPITRAQERWEALAAKLPPATPDDPEAQKKAEAAWWESVKDENPADVFKAVLSRIPSYRELARRIKDGTLDDPDPVPLVVGGKDLGLVENMRKIGRRNVPRSKTEVQLDMADGTKIIINPHPAEWMRDALDFGPDDEIEFSTGDWIRVESTTKDDGALGWKLVEDGRIKRDEMQGVLDSVAPVQDVTQKIAGIRYAIWEDAVRQAAYDFLSDAKARGEDMDRGMAHTMTELVSVLSAASDYQALGRWLRARKKTPFEYKPQQAAAERVVQHILEKVFAPGTDASEKIARLQRKVPDPARQQMLNELRQAAAEEDALDYQRELADDLAEQLGIDPEDALKRIQEKAVPVQETSAASQEGLTPADLYRNRVESRIRTQVRKAMDTLWPGEPSSKLSDTELSPPTAAVSPEDKAYNDIIRGLKDKFGKNVLPVALLAGTIGLLGATPAEAATLAEGIHAVGQVAAHVGEALLGGTALAAAGAAKVGGQSVAGWMADAVKALNDSSFVSQLRDRLYLEAEDIQQKPRAELTQAAMTPEAKTILRGRIGPESAPGRVARGLAERAAAIADPYVRLDTEVKKLLQTLGESVVSLPLELFWKEVAENAGIDRNTAQSRTFKAVGDYLVQRLIAQKNSVMSRIATAMGSATPDQRMPKQYLRQWQHEADMMMAQNRSTIQRFVEYFATVYNKTQREILDEVQGNGGKIPEWAADDPIVGIYFALLPEMVSDLQSWGVIDGYHAAIANRFQIRRMAEQTAGFGSRFKQAVIDTAKMVMGRRPGDEADQRFWWGRGREIVMTKQQALEYLRPWTVIEKESTPTYLTLSDGTTKKQVSLVPDDQGVVEAFDYVHMNPETNQWESPWLPRNENFETKDTMSLARPWTIDELNANGIIRDFAATADRTWSLWSRTAGKQALYDRIAKSPVTPDGQEIAIRVNEVQDPLSPGPRTQARRSLPGGPANWVKLQGKRWGALQGHYLRKDVHDFINTQEQNDDLLRVVDAWRREFTGRTALGNFKFFKNNLLGMLGNLDANGVSWARLPQAFLEMYNRTPFYRFLESNGGYEGTSFAEIRRELESGGMRIGSISRAIESAAQRGTLKLMEAIVKKSGASEGTAANLMAALRDVLGSTSFSVANKFVDDLGRTALALHIRDLQPEGADRMAIPQVMRTNSYSVFRPSSTWQRLAIGFVPWASYPIWSMSHLPGIMAGNWQMALIQNGKTKLAAMIAKALAALAAGEDESEEEKKRREAAERAAAYNPDLPGPLGLFEPPTRLPVTQGVDLDLTQMNPYEPMAQMYGAGKTLAETGDIGAAVGIGGRNLPFSLGGPLGSAVGVDLSNVGSLSDIAEQVPYAAFPALGVPRDISNYLNYNEPTPGRALTGAETNLLRQFGLRAAPGMREMSQMQGAIARLENYKNQQITKLDRRARPGALNRISAEEAEKRKNDVRERVTAQQNIFRARIDAIMQYAMPASGSVPAETPAPGLSAIIPSATSSVQLPTIPLR